MNVIVLLGSLHHHSLHFITSKNDARVGEENKVRDIFSNYYHRDHSYQNPCLIAQEKFQQMMAQNQPAMYLRG